MVPMWISYLQVWWITFRAYPPPVENVEKLSTENVEKSKDELSALIANIAGNITSYSWCGKCGKVIHRKC
jgi:hypothetical protein